MAHSSKSCLLLLVVVVVVVVVDNGNANSMFTSCLNNYYNFFLR